MNFSELQRNDREFKAFRDAGSGLTKRAVVVEQDISDPIPVEIVDSSGNPVHLFGQDVTDPGNWKSVISYTVTAGYNLNLNNYFVSCSVEGVAKLEIDSVIVGKCRTAPGKSDAIFIFDPAKEIAPGSVLNLYFMARTNSQITDIDGAIQGIEKTI